MKSKNMLIGGLAMLAAVLMCGCSSMQGSDKELAEFLIQAVKGTEVETADTGQISTETTEKETTHSTTSSEADKTTEQISETTEEVEATTAAPEEIPAWKEAYIAKARELDTSDSQLIEALLLDLDQDGMPELIASQIVSGGDVYTYADGQVIGLQYPDAGDGAKQYYQQGNKLISVSIGGDSMSGQSIMIGEKRGNIMGWTGYSFSWDENMNPFVNVFQSAGSYTPTYEEACASLAELGVHISYSPETDYEPYLLYTVVVDSPTLNPWNNMEETEAGIRAW